MRWLLLNVSLLVATVCSVLHSLCCNTDTQTRTCKEDAGCHNLQHNDCFAAWLVVQARSQQGDESTWHDYNTGWKNRKEHPHSSGRNLSQPPESFRIPTPKKCRTSSVTCFLVDILHVGRWINNCNFLQCTVNFHWVYREKTNELNSITNVARNKAAAWKNSIPLPHKLLYN